MTNKWDRYFIDMAKHVSTLSRDPNSKVGAVIVGPDREVRSTGYNDFPRGIQDDVIERRERPEKYIWTEHAERNAIYNAARHGASLKGCTLYMTGWPLTCADCARGVIQAGIVEVVVEAESFLNRDVEKHINAELMLFEAGVKVRII